MAVLALAVAAFSSMRTGSLDSTRFRAFAIETSAALQAVRVTSIRGRQEQVFRIDIKRRTLGVADGGPMLELPEGLNSPPRSPRPSAMATDPTASGSFPAAAPPAAG